MRQSLLTSGSAGAGAPGSPAYKVVLDQLNASCEELDVRKEEVLILRSQLVSQKEAMQHKVPGRRPLLVSAPCISSSCNFLVSPTCVSSLFQFLVSPPSVSSLSQLLVSSPYFASLFNMLVQ